VTQETQTEMGEDSGIMQTNVRYSKGSHHTTPDLITYTFVVGKATDLARRTAVNDRL